MTKEEFELKVRGWERQMERVLIEMDSITNEDGLLLHCHWMPIAEAFNAEVERLRKALESGVVRCGMRVYEK